MSEESSLETGDQRYVKQKRMFSFLAPNTIPPIPTQEERKPFYSILSVYNTFFWWMMHTIKVGYVRTIRAPDLPYLPSKMTVEQLDDDFQSKLEYYTHKSGKNPHEMPPSVFWKALLASYKYQFLVFCVCMIQESAVTSLAPYVSKHLIEFCTQRSLGLPISYGKGVGYAVGVTLMVFIGSLLQNQALYISCASSFQVRAILTKRILTKAMKADAKSRHMFPGSKLMVLLGTDLSKIETGISFGLLVLATPVTIIITVVMLSINLGVTVLVALGVLSLFIGVFVYMSALLVKSRIASLKATDARVNKVKEMVENLRIIKYYSWEIPYLRTTNNLRSVESKKLLSLHNLRSNFFVIVLAIGPITSMISFVVLWAIDAGRKTAATVFSSVGLIESLGNSFLVLPYIVSVLVDAVLSFNRIVEFLNSGEIQNWENVDYHPDATVEKGDTVVKVENGTFVWEKYPEKEEEETDEITDLEEAKRKAKEKKRKAKEAKKKAKLQKKLKIKEEEEPMMEAFRLHGINIDIKKGEFVMIVGPIGSGKSSLLSALSGMMKRIEGHSSVLGKMLLCGAPWVQNATIKDNILFGDDFDQKRYLQTVYACAYDADLKNLPAGENTEVGEKGITLSGGQKARLSLARAVYADSDVYFLDDVLSAVDAKVGKHIMDTCFNGMLKDKTRVLATHQLSFLGYADKVVFVNDDGTIDYGTVDELSSRNEAFLYLMSHKDRDDEKGEEKSLESSEESTVSSEKFEELSQHELEKEVAKNEVMEVEKYRTDGKLIEEEVSAENSVDGEVYWSIFRLGSAPFHPYVYILLTLTVTVLGVFASLFTTTWLSFWTSNKFEGRSTGFYIGIYVMFTFISIPFMVVQLIFYVRVIVIASKYLNIKAMNRFLFVPMSYLDVTPVGRILNRFTKDTDAIDNLLVQNVRLVVYISALMIGTFILAAVYLPWLLIVYPFLVFMIMVIGSLYQATSREVKRLESTQRSLVYNNFNESVSGLDVIRTFGRQDNFLLKNNKFLNDNNESSIVVDAIQRWATFWVAIVAGIYVLVISLLSVFGVFDINPSSVGLVISYVVSIPGLLNDIVKNYALIENEMTSYQRIYEYANDLPQEAPYNIAETAPPHSWPEHGKIVFDNASMRYRDNLPKALSNVSLTIEPFQKIGICGRTGAGKSTITSTLYRMTELCEGSIFVDGIDISTLGLNELRSKLSIIPQESVLVEGSVRTNLDPFNATSEDDLWEALRKTGLIKPEELPDVRAQKKGEQLHKFHLDANVEEGGKNISLGERQLISFARALVKKSSILILDEATSSVDYATDAKIQKTIREEFSHCTILCIAHRLRTILKYDKILVLDKGRVQEFDSPLELYRNEQSTFRMLCDKSKITEGDF